jgi:hypothetical protein
MKGAKKGKNEFILFLAFELSFFLDLGEGEKRNMCIRCAILSHS